MGAPSLITRYARAMLHAAETQGHDLAEICRTAGVNPDAIGPEIPFIGAETFGRLNRVIKVALDDEFCGYTARRCKAGTLPFICESIIHEDTLGDALRRAFRFYGLLSSGLGFSLDEAGEVATLRLTLDQPELDRFLYLHEWWMIIWSHLSSWLIGEEIPVTRVDFPYAPRADVDEYVEAFWGPCHFHQPAARSQFPARFLRRRIIRSMDDVVQLFTGISINLVSVGGIHRSWKALIKTKMKECLVKTENLLSIEELATEFNMSSQTLRRRLEDEGVTFRALKEEVRREVILKWLSEPDLPIGEVSLRAGFAERNGLVRAVRSWVGVSPKEYRVMMMDNRPPPPADIPRPGPAQPGARTRH